ncbi:MAG TPA: hypothetical protein VFQ85_03800 [Mycobacteriales bacterium]|nr:hypothetical protein [Mycobacteriales bacterium]
MKRRLVLRREALAEVTPDDLRAVGGAATLAGACGALTVFVQGCVSDPRFCNYVTDLC